MRQGLGWGGVTKKEEYSRLTGYRLQVRVGSVYKTKVG